MSEPPQTNMAFQTTSKQWPTVDPRTIEAISVLYSDDDEVLRIPRIKADEHVALYLWTLLNPKCKDFVLKRPHYPSLSLLRVHCTHDRLKEFAATVAAAYATAKNVQYIAYSQISSVLVLEEKPRTRLLAAVTACSRAPGIEPAVIETGTELLPSCNLEGQAPDTALGASHDSKTDRRPWWRFWSAGQ